jgi:hypothetical protein
LGCTSECAMVRKWALAWVVVRATGLVLVWALAMATVWALEWELGLELGLAQKKAQGLWALVSVEQLAKELAGPLGAGMEPEWVRRSATGTEPDLEDWLEVGMAQALGCTWAAVWVGVLALRLGLGLLHCGEVRRQCSTRYRPHRDCTNQG